MQIIGIFCKFVESNVTMYHGYFTNSINYYFPTNETRQIVYEYQLSNDKFQYNTFDYHTVQVRMLLFAGSKYTYGQLMMCGTGYYFPTLQRTIFRLVQEVCIQQNLTVEQAFSIAYNSYYHYYRFAQQNTSVQNLEDCVYQGIIKHQKVVGFSSHLPNDLIMQEKYQKIAQRSYLNALDVTQTSGYFAMQSQNGIGGFLYGDLIHMLYYPSSSPNTYMKLDQHQMQIKSIECNIAYTATAHAMVAVSNDLWTALLILLSAGSLITGIYLQSHLNQIDVTTNFTLLLPQKIDRNSRKSVVSMVIYNADLFLHLCQQIHCTILLLLLGWSVQYNNQQYYLITMISVLWIIFVDMKQILQVYDLWHLVYEFDVGQWLMWLLIFLCISAFVYLGMNITIEYSALPNTIVFCTCLLQYICRIIKSCCLRKKQLMNMKLLMIQFLYHSLQQFISILICIGSLSSENVFGMIGNDVSWISYLLASIGLLLFYILILFIKVLLSRRQQTNFELYGGPYSYQFVKQQRSKEIGQLSVTLPFFPPLDQVSYECHNPNHQHSKYFQQDKFQIKVFRDGSLQQVQNNAIPSESVCFMLVEYERLLSIQCPICLDKINLLTQHLDAFKIGEIFVQKEEIPSDPLKQQVVIIDEVEADGEDERKVITTRCGHCFHDDCLLQWIGKENQQCPVCRTCLLK